MTLPVKRAGAIFPVASIKGKFHGTIAPMTLGGTCLVITVLVSSSSITSSISGRLAIPRIQLMALLVSSVAWKICSICVKSTVHIQYQIVMTYRLALFGDQEISELIAVFINSICICQYGLLPILIWRRRSELESSFSGRSGFVKILWCCNWNLWQDFQGRGVQSMASELRRRALAIDDLNKVRSKIEVDSHIEIFQLRGD
jgi:hypothetical protein